jgi:hypothetical protein
MAQYFGGIREYAPKNIYLQEGKTKLKTKINTGKIDKNNKVLPST